METSVVAIAESQPVERKRITPWLIGVGVVTFLAGLLFGYDQGVISGALPRMLEEEPVR